MAVRSLEIGFISVTASRAAAGAGPRAPACQRVRDDLLKPGPGQHVADVLLVFEVDVARLRGERVGEECGRQAVVAVDPGDLLDQVGRPDLNVDAVRRRGHAEQGVDRLDLEPERGQRARGLGGRHGDAEDAVDLARGQLDDCGSGLPGYVSTTPGLTDPLQCSWNRYAARAAARADDFRVNPLAEPQAGLARQIECPHRPARMLTRSKLAASSSTFVVLSETSVSSPPMTPARAIGPAASAITSVSGVSLRSTLSRVTSVSPDWPGVRRSRALLPSPS